MKAIHSKPKLHHTQPSSALEGTNQMNVYNIIQELNENNGANYKMDVLRKHADNQLLQRVLKMTYDKVDYTFGITATTVDTNDIMIGGETSGMGSFDPDGMDLEFALDILVEYFAERKVTGHDARDVYRDLLYACDRDTAFVVMGIINRDLRINMGRSNINKVFKGLIVKPVYMRCGLFTAKTRDKINPQGAYVQLKADGTYREFTVEAGQVICNSRSGESYDYPVLNSILATYPDGHYIGELTVMLDGAILDRATGNGMINSDNVPHDNLVLDLWDYVTLEEYTNAANKIKGVTPYYARFAQLQAIVGYGLGGYVQQVRVITTHIVNSFSEALHYCTDWMNEGLEGAILKDRDAIFRDGTNDQQQKMKIEFSLDVRITGFKEGKTGTKRENTFGSLMYSTDDGNIVGTVSGFTDVELLKFNSDRNCYIGKIIEINGNDLTQGRSNQHYAISHPRFVCLRDDKDTTDDLKRAQESLEMSRSFGIS